ncbi:MAG: phage tail protein [Akkermansiaceae bacterium]
MSKQPQLGRDLYQILPAVYRDRDTGDLEKFLNVCGDLLDGVQGTLVQRLADQFPDNPDGGLPSLASDRTCQDWLLPYFADLLDVRLLSPLADGQRDEISKAVSWRQRKGTLAVIEQVAEAISQSESVIHEGWKRVAVTPQIGKPLLSASVYGYEKEPDSDAAALMAKHPDLPAVSVDLRCSSGAVKTDEGNAAAQYASIEGQERRWRQAGHHGVPCYPGSYEDVSRRSVDFRTPNWKQGHFHPRRILLFTVPEAGFFPENVETVLWTDRDDEESKFHELIKTIETEEGLTIFQNRTWGTDNYVPVRIRRVVELDSPSSGDDMLWRFQGLIFDNTLLLHHGKLELIDCAARKAELHTIDFKNPVMTAQHCLFGSIQAARGICRMEYCTVLGSTLIEIPQVSDCIFAEPINKDHADETPPEKGCVRFSRVSLDQTFAGASSHANTREELIFYADKFGQRGAGVLHPESSDKICHGAEDGGEMGAFHDHYYCRIRAAVLEKLKDYLPIGYSAVLIPDQRLLSAPINND